MLALGRQKYGIPRFAETSPDVLQQIVFDQHAYGILELQVVPDNKWIARNSTLEGRTPLHPLPRFEEVIQANGNVGWSRARRSSTEQNGLGRRFQKVVLDLINSILVIAAASTNRVRLRTRAADRGTVEIAEVRVYDRHIICAREVETIPSLVLRRSVQPASIEDD